MLHDLNGYTGREHRRVDGAVVQAEMLGARTLVVDDEDGHREMSTARLDG